ncbi:TetR family transcriptional regulator [Kiloniella laminariae]|uniref:TetR family transcriptional regulator n=1 Tax=Kiloniella laminariae TaxID=454162 RepID=A0ABT4LFG9_9PROT|nr:TetR family transcriptional regulator [Kiloniella laminariae]MCZ4279850.1 TetR family transcriptional regulator [Kiloniella laminariae]
MRISSKQKEANRSKLIAVAVELFSEQGFHNVSMKQIAKAAGMGDSSVYKYFPNKDKFLLAYHEGVLFNILDLVEENADFADFTLEEKLQFFVYNYLDELLENREFVAESLEILRNSPSFLMQREFPASKALKKKLGEILDQAIEAGEIPDLPLQGAITHLMVDGLLGTVLYWLQDDSEDFTQTTQFVEITIGFFTTVLKSGVIGKGADLVSFLFKSQVMRFMDSGTKMPGMMGGMGGAMGGAVGLAALMKGMGSFVSRGSRHDK